MSSRLGQLAAYVGGAGALGYGVYYSVQMKEISKFEKEADDIAKHVEKEKKSLKNSTALIAETEGKIQELQKAQGVQSADLRRTEDKLDAARREVAALEQEYSKKAEQFSKTQAEFKASTARLNNLRSEADWLKEALTMGEKSLAIARQKSEEARKLLNPMHHPMLANKK